MMLDTVCDALEVLRMDRLLGYASVQALASGVAGMLFDLVCNPLTVCCNCMHALLATANRTLVRYKSAHSPLCKRC